MNSKVELTAEVIAVLDNAEIEDNRLILTGGQLDRRLYLEVNAVLEALGGKWDRRAKAHLFPANPRDRLEAAILNGSVVNMDKELDFFPTPSAVARKIVEAADIQAYHRILEPSAGNGALLDALIAAGFVESVDVCEIDPDRRQHLVESYQVTLVGEDFLAYQPGAVYDRIIANPPLSRRLDLEHVAHMYDLLAPDGLLVSVMAAGIKFRLDAKMRQFIERVRCYQIADLPAGAFHESGTDVNTVLVRIHK